MAAPCRRRRCWRRPSAPTLARRRRPVPSPERRAPAPILPPRATMCARSWRPRRRRNRASASTGSACGWSRAGRALPIPRPSTVNGFDIRARRFVIATGSSPSLPAIPGLADTPHLTEETVFDLPDCPRHLIVIGAGSTGLELAQAFRRLGAAVTVLDNAEPLADDDAECAGIVLDGLAREGVVMRSGVDVAQVRRALARVQVDIATAAGRRNHRRHAIFSSPPGGGRTWKISISTRPASATAWPASRSTRGCAPPTNRSMPSATSPAGRGSPISPITTPAL